MTERRVGMYTCGKCGTKFPTVISKQRYLIVAEEQLKSIQDELESIKKGNEDLGAKVQGMAQQQREMESSMVRTAKENDVKRLQAKLADLEEFVAYLRKEKGELEQKASRVRWPRPLRSPRVEEHIPLRLHTRRLSLPARLSPS